MTPLRFLAALMQQDCIARAVLLRVASTSGCVGVTAEAAATAAVAEVPAHPTCWPVYIHRPARDYSAVGVGEGCTHHMVCVCLKWKVELQALLFYCWFGGSSTS